jgi:hypothetical protein
MDKPNVTSRRTVLKALPAAAVVTVVPAAALAQRPARLPELIAAYNKAHEAFVAAIDPLEEAEERLKKMPPPRVHLSRAPDGSIGSGYMEFYEGHEDAIRREIKSVHDNLRDRWCGKIAVRMVPDHVEAMRAVLDASEAACLAELESMGQRVEEMRAAAGVTSAKNEYDTTCNAEDEAVLAILEYVPASPEEARAKSAWLLPKVTREIFFGEEEIQALIRSVAGEA